MDYCHCCGALQLPPRPKWVTLSDRDGNNPTTYLLGPPAGRDKIFCLAKGVPTRENEWVRVRVCYWQSYFRDGSAVFTSGKLHRFHSKDPE